MHRLEEVFSAQATVVSSPALVLMKIEGEIEFCNLSFRYPGAPDYCLRDISYKINKGESVAIIGMIGAGKSSLVQLLPRIFDAKRGMVLIDAVPIQDVDLEDLRRCIGYVEQEPFLFSASLRENIIFGYETATEDEVKDVVRLAGLEPDLQRFPQGLDTLVGERGVSLSGGQKQRVALARALIKKPKILVLDDAFSSLDVETEETVLKNIREFIRGVTTIIVTHRLAVTQYVDRIIVLENGRVVESGTYLVRGGYYRQVYENQEMEIVLR